MEVELPVGPPKAAVNGGIVEDERVAEGAAVLARKGFDGCSVAA